MTNLSNLKNEIKLESVKTFVAVLVILILGWGVSSSAVDDIKSANSNFNVIGVVSKISDKEITVTDAKGTNSSSDTSYNLNVEYLTTIETNAYIPMNFSDIKIGDRIIAQGLTNNSTFFIKRIISFDSIPTPVIAKEVATSTLKDVVIATTTDVGTSTLTESVIDSSTGTETKTETKTDPVIEATSTDMGTTTIISTTTEETSTSTGGIVDTIKDTINDVIDTVKDVVDTVVDTVTGTPAPETVDTPSTDTSAQNIPVQDLINNSTPVNQ